jgi:uncharacterized protein (DUF3084 family)
MAQDRSAIHTDRSDIRTDRDDNRTDDGNIAQNQAAMRTDVNNIRTDRQDLRSDRHDLRTDAADLHGANPSATQPTAHSGSATQPQNPKSTLSPSTLANNAAENSKKTQTEQNTHKAWYHWTW